MEVVSIHQAQSHLPQLIKRIDSEMAIHIRAYAYHSGTSQPYRIED